MRLIVARIGRAHGIRGEVSIESRTDSPGERFVPGAVLHSTGRGDIGTGDGPEVPAQLTVRTVRDHNGTLLLTFEQIEDRSAAETLRNVLLEADVPEHTDEADAWYDHELVGLAAISPAGEALGTVTAVQHGGAQDLLTIQRPDGQHRLVPFVTAIVPTVDVAGGHLVLDAPAGLLEDLETEQLVRIDVVTIFPEYLAPLDLSLIGKARRTGLLDLRIHDLRDFTHDRHRTVDDAPAGGGAGMVMRPEPWGEALDSLIGPGPEAPVLLVPSPSGVRFDQRLAHELGSEPWLAFACGRYEGIDERVLDEYAGRVRLLPVSLGDYVLNGGEVAVLVIVEAVARLLPGVIGNAESLVEESHEDGLLEYPVYTRPAQWRGREVPAVLASGHHAQVDRWRRDQRIERTSSRRPDLIEALDPDALDRADLAVLDQLGWEPRPNGPDGGFRRRHPLWQTEDLPSAHRAPATGGFARSGTHLLVRSISGGSTETLVARPDLRG